jgi:MFS family permease
VLSPYQALLATPGAKAFVIAGFIARLPMAMSAIGIITMLSQLRGSFSLASTVAGTFVLCSAFVAPQISRLVDRHGQSKVLPLAAFTSATGLLALAACTHWQAPDWTLYAFALLAGCKPSMPAMSRSRWTTLLGGSAKLHTAYALESVLDEACFIVGPPLAVGLSVAVFAQAGPMAAAILLVLGVLLFTAQRQTEPPIRPQVAGAQREGSVLRLPSVQALAWVMLGLGAINGAIDVTSVAFAKRSGQPAAASLVLSAYAAGSFVAGLLFGVAKHNVHLLSLLKWGGLATVLSALLLMFASGIPSLSVVMLISGLSVAPTMIIAMILVEKNVPASRLTEALTWLITGLNVGISVGAICAGQIVDAYRASAGFGVAVVAGVITLLAAHHASRRVSG